MKLILKNTALEFQLGLIQVSERVGNTTSGITLHTYFKPDGTEQYLASGNYGLSPFYDISKLASDIVITKVFSNFNSPHTCVVFYSSADASAIVGVHEQGTGGNQATTTILRTNIPETAKYIRFAGSYITNVTPDSSDASTITFRKTRF